MKKERKTYRLSQADLDIIKGHKGKDDTEKLHNILQAFQKLEDEKERLKEKQVVDRALKGTTELSKSFDYETWYCDCEYGTYLKEKRKVFCRCTYPSIKKWLPRNRFVEPQVCDECLPKVQGIKEWIAQKEGSPRKSGEIYCSYGYGRGFLSKEEQLKICGTCTHFGCPHHPQIRGKEVC